jgi:hypothetical protein
MKLYNVINKFLDEEYLLLAPNDTRALDLADDRLLRTLKGLRPSDENDRNEIEKLKQDDNLRKQQLHIKMLEDNFTKEGIIAVRVV